MILPSSTNFRRIAAASTLAGNISTSFTRRNNIHIEGLRAKAGSFHCFISMICSPCHGSTCLQSFGGRATADCKYDKKTAAPSFTSIPASFLKNAFQRPSVSAFMKNGKGLRGGFVCLKRETAGEREKSEGKGEHGKQEALCMACEQQTNERVQRRKGSPLLGQGNVDLLTVPGIGPRNMQKLVEKGIGNVSDLKQLYRDRFRRGGSERMVEYLRASVGIVHKNHAESITSFIRDSVDKELKDETLHESETELQKRRLTFCVEGNISVGKTTFLHRIANETVELRDLVEVVPEPISKWQDVGPEHFNILNAFYTQPQRYAYTFQNYVFVTRVMQEQESSRGIKPLRLMERSVFSDRMVFVRAVHEAKWMNQMELSIYDSWFDPVVSVLPGLVPDGFIYLRASPDTCHKRLHMRKRAEEETIPFEYLQGLHEKHERWLFPARCAGDGLLSVSHLPADLDISLNSTIKDRIMLLHGDHLHASIQKVPALILDYEPHIDFSKDIEAKREYARQIADFFKFVKTLKERQIPEQGTAALKKALLRPSSGLIGPQHNLLRPSFNSAEFWKSVFYE